MNIETFIPSADVAQCCRDAGWKFSLREQALIVWESPVPLREKREVFVHLQKVADGALQRDIDKLLREMDEAERHMRKTPPGMVIEAGGELYSSLKKGQAGLRAAERANMLPRFWPFYLGFAEEKAVDGQAGDPYIFFLNDAFEVSRWICIDSPLFPFGDALTLPVPFCNGDPVAWTQNGELRRGLFVRHKGKAQRFRYMECEVYAEDGRAGLARAQAPILRLQRDRARLTPFLRKVSAYMKTHEYEPARKTRTTLPDLLRPR